jgi:predicted transcriptional regulator
MKSVIIKNDEVHKKLKILSVSLNTTISDLLEEAINDVICKHREVRYESV